MERVVVTGGCGFIGSTLVRRLTRQISRRIVNIDALTYAGVRANVAEAEERPNYQFEHVDIRNQADVERILAEFQPHGVIHLAADTHVDRSIDEPLSLISTNVQGTAVLLRAVHQYVSRRPYDEQQSFRFVQVSSDEVYGSVGLDKECSEDAMLAPNSPYSASKAAGDHLARAWWRTYGLQTVICRSANNFGPFQFPEKLIPRTILSAISGRPIEVYGRGENVRDWLFVEDNVEALIAVLDNSRPGEIYNIGGGTRRRNIDLVREVCDLLDEMLQPRTPHSELIALVADRPGHDLRYATDCSKVRHEVGWTATTPLSEGLRKTVAWYLENKSWWEGLRSEDYDGSRLGLI